MNKDDFLKRCGMESPSVILRNETKTAVLADVSRLVKLCQKSQLKQAAGFAGIDATKEKQHIQAAFVINAVGEFLRNNTGMPWND